MTSYIENLSPRRLVLYGESLEDLKLMPTTTTVGKPPYEKALVPEGTYAEILTSEGLDKYMLSATGWVKVGSGEGGGGGGLPPDYSWASTDDIDNLFN